MFYEFFILNSVWLNSNIFSRHFLLTKIVLFNVQGGLESAFWKLSFGEEELEKPVAELVEHIPLAVEVKDFSTERLVLEPPSELAPESVLVNVEGGL